MGFYLNKDLCDINLLKLQFYKAALEFSSSRMTENLEQKTLVQPPLKNSSTFETNKDEKYLNIIKRLSIGVIVISVICFICGIANLIVSYLSIGQGIWCPVLPVVAGVLGVTLRSNSKSSSFN